MLRALEGFRVLDLSRILAGPFCAMLLGDLGAEGIKVERPGSGDDTRAWGPPFTGGESAYYLCANRNKKSSTMRTLGKHPNSGETLVVKEGRYGPYISDGKVNASLNKTVDPETITLEIATELINEKRAKGTTKKGRKKR